MRVAVDTRSFKKVLAGRPYLISSKSLIAAKRQHHIWPALDPEPIRHLELTQSQSQPHHPITLIYISHQTNIMVSHPINQRNDNI